MWELLSFSRRSRNQHALITAQRFGMALRLSDQATPAGYSAGGGSRAQVEPHSQDLNPAEMRTGQYPGHDRCLAEEWDFRGFQAAG